MSFRLNTALAPASDSHYWLTHSLVRLWLLQVQVSFIVCAHVYLTLLTRSDPTDLLLQRFSSSSCADDGFRWQNLRSPQAAGELLAFARRWRNKDGSGPDWSSCIVERRLRARLPLAGCDLLFGVHCVPVDSSCPERRCHLSLYLSLSLRLGLAKETNDYWLKYLSGFAILFLLLSLGATMITSLFGNQLPGFLSALRLPHHRPVLHQSRRVVRVGIGPPTGHTQQGAEPGRRP